MTSGPVAIDLALVSHTNAGKTTLARTLLGREVGEVRDIPHVTELSQSHVLLESAAGDVMRLWDTPGFGDSMRLAKRLRTADNPIGWFLREVWDRYRNRPLWCSQQAVRTVRESAEVVLYLVNAADDPRDAGYVAPEMQILGWIGKPVLLLLNQMGPPRSLADECAEADRWRDCVAPFKIVRAVLSFDAFARCWVQEATLLRRVVDLLAPQKRPAMERLIVTWRVRNLERFEQSMAVLARQLASAVSDRQAIGAAALPDRSRRVLAAVGLGDNSASDAREQAMAALAARLDDQIRSATDRLIALHGLEGQAASTVLERLREHYTLTEPVSQAKAAAIGGIASGALTGLMADLASGGLTLGLGVVAGAIAGALGGAGVARGHNLVRGVDRSSVAWSAEFLDALVRSALLRYLAVAHFGRGRGAYAQGEAPSHWQAEVEQAFGPRRGGYEALWENARASGGGAQIETDLQAFLSETAAEVLERLYPDAFPEGLAAMTREPSRTM